VHVYTPLSLPTTWWLSFTPVCFQLRAQTLNPCVESVCESVCWRPIESASSLSETATWWHRTFWQEDKMLQGGIVSIVHFIAQSLHVLRAALDSSHQAYVAGSNAPVFVWCLPSVVQPHSLAKHQPLLCICSSSLLTFVHPYAWLAIQIRYTSVLSLDHTW
jgi:hypothetical protein